MMLASFLITSGRTHELLPCGLQWRRLVKLFKKSKSPFYWFDFTVRGHRYRGSTQETNAARAGKIAGLKLAAAIEGSDPLDRKAPTLREFSQRFLEWVENVNLENKTKLYYENGWRLLAKMRIAGMRLNQIKKDDVEALRFDGSPSNANCALRTLRRMLHKAEEWELIRSVPKFKLVKEYGRSSRLDDAAEKELLTAAVSCGWRKSGVQLFRDIIILMRDTGMRNERELYRVRIENIDWSNRVAFVPDSKTPDGRRTVPISDRALEVFRARCAGRRSGWVFPSKRSRAGHLTTMANRFREAREKAGLPEGLVLYCGRHDYGTRVLKQTGNLKAVMLTMGHKDVKTAMRYQHPEVEVVRQALNQPGGSAPVGTK
jgi:integrase